MTIAQLSSGYQPRIAALATAVPKHVLDQDAVEKFGKHIFGENAAMFDRLRPIYENAGIKTRYSCVDIDWYGQEHTWPERNDLFLEHAVDLLYVAAERCLEKAELLPSDIDGLVIVSTTGIATPSLDALLMERMPFRRNVQRMPIFGLGCAGGVLGLSRAAALARATPGSKWLVLVVELCGLTFRRQDMSKSNIVATALFGDGAAGVVLSGEGAGPAIGVSGEYMWPDTLEVMGWKIKDDGMGVLFRRDIPDLVRNDMHNAASEFLGKNHLGVQDIDEFVFHPGGEKVINALRDCFELPDEALRHARSVLRDYGNMSAATVLFVLERALNAGAKGRMLLSALGPGFTAGFLTLEASTDVKRSQEMPK